MSIDNPYAAIRKREVEIGGKENFSFADVVNDFRSEYRKKGYSKPGLLVSNLATFNGRQAGQSRSRTCICGSKHSWVRCYYLNPSQRPEGWKENDQRRKNLTKKDPSITTKLRHVDIYGNWLRERIQSGDISVQWTPTSNMPADGLTKPLSQQRQREFIKQIGLVDITDLVNKTTK
ncbi:hypothetical protein I7I48_06516 [Histoplasma ohiense]|nr:hypothetical protein I7I48_06516 [Histoplasma ohiense (nom. inval.)]